MDDRSTWWAAVTGRGNKWTWALKDRDNRVRVKSKKTYSSPEAAREAAWKEQDG